MDENVQTEIRKAENLELASQGDRERSFLVLSRSWDKEKKAEYPHDLQDYSFFDLSVTINKQI